MKNVTLSIPEDLLTKARSFAKANGTSMNEMIRELLRKTVEKDQSNFKEEILEARKAMGIDTRKKINRDELYER